jgi:hypothetical protein
MESGGCKSRTAKAITQCKIWRKWLSRRTRGKGTKLETADTDKEDLPHAGFSSTRRVLDFLTTDQFPLLIAVSQRQITSAGPTIYPQPWSSFPRARFWITSGSPAYAQNGRARTALVGSFPSAVRRRGLPRSDLILEVIGIEAVESAFGRFRLGVHEEPDRRTFRPG